MSETEQRQETCAQRIEGQLKGRVDDLRLLKWAYERDNDDGACLDYEADEDGDCENCSHDLGAHWQALAKADEFRDSFGYDLFDDSQEGPDQAWLEHPLSVDSKLQVRVQMSWGGPSDEYLLTVDEDGDIGEIRYRFMDWFDGATKTLDGEDQELVEWFCQRFVEYERMKIAERS